MRRPTEDEMLMAELYHGAVFLGLPRGVAVAAAQMAATKEELAALTYARRQTDKMVRELMMTSLIAAIWSRCCMDCLRQHLSEVQK